MNTTIYIRKENKEVWKNLVNKSDWVNWHLTEKRTSGSGTPLEAKDDEAIKAAHTALKKAKVPTEDRVVGFVVDDPDEPLEPQVQRLTRPLQEYCKHGFAKGFCKKGCK